MCIGFGARACVLGLACFGTRGGFPLGLGAQHRRRLRAFLRFEAPARQIPRLGFCLSVQPRGLGGTRFELLARPRGDCPILLGPRSQLRCVARLLLGAQTGFGLARRGRFRFHPRPRLLCGAGLRLGVGLPGAAEFLLEPRPFLLRGTDRRVERLPDAQRLERVRLGFGPLARLLHGGLFGAHQGFRKRVRDGIGVGALLGRGARLRLHCGALERGLSGARFRADARFGFLQELRFGQIERWRGLERATQTRVFRPLDGGIGIEGEPDVAGFLGSHGSLRGRRNQRRNSEQYHGFGGMGGFLSGARAPPAPAGGNATPRRAAPSAGVRGRGLRAARVDRCALRVGRAAHPRPRSIRSARGRS